MFLGLYRATIDDKGRLPLPEKWRAELLQGLVLTRGVDRCLYIFPRNKFTSLAQQIDELGVANADVRNWTRFLSGLATDLDVDRQGRIVVPPPLRQFAGLDGEVDLVGVMTRIEVWAPAKYQELETQGASAIAEVAERVDGILRALPRSAA